MHYLPKTNKFGQLKLLTEYLWYDCPRTFVAGNKKRKVFIHWADELDDSDVWYYVNISDDEKTRLENGDVQLRDIFYLKDILEVTTPFDRKMPVIEKILSFDKIDPDSLPEPGLCLCKNESGEFDFIEKEAEEFIFNSEVHEIKLYKQRSTKDIPWSAVNAILTAWGNLCNYIIGTESDEASDKVFFTPLAATLGSYKQQFKASNNKELLAKLNEMSALISSNNDVGVQLRELDVDPALVEELMSALEDSELKLDIMTNTGGVFSTLDSRGFEAASRSITEYNQRNISSDLIPQADEVCRIIKLVKSKSEGKLFNSETENIVPRQIMYYQTASKIMGFTKPNGILTPIGHRLAEAKTEKEQYTIILERFEITDCGWAWMKHCEVNNVCDIPKGTAANFLINRSKGLKESTARRRARTLESWLLKFKEYCK